MFEYSHFLNKLRIPRTIIGPVIGGYLAEPVKKYPFLFQKGTIWDKFPDLLPNVVVVIFLLGGCILGLFFMEVVHPKSRDQVDIRWILASGIQNIFRGKAWKTDEDIYTPFGLTRQMWKRHRVQHPRLKPSKI